MIKGRLGTREDVNKYVEMLRRAGCTIQRDPDKIVARHDGQVIFRALEKGRKQPWIMMFLNSELITWRFDEN